MRLCGVCGVQWWCLEDLLGDVGDWCAAQHLVLTTQVSSRSLES